MLTNFGNQDIQEVWLEMLFIRNYVLIDVLSYLQLQRAFERGDIKPGLNFAADIDARNKEMKNDVVKLLVFVMFYLLCM